MAESQSQSQGKETGGKLYVVGIGPGQASWRTPEVSKLVAEAEELVGYGLYIDLLGPLAADARAAEQGVAPQEATDQDAHADLRHFNP